MSRARVPRLETDVEKVDHSITWMVSSHLAGSPAGTFQPPRPLPAGFQELLPFYLSRTEGFHGLFFRELGVNLGAFAAACAVRY